MWAPGYGQGENGRGRRRWRLKEEPHILRSEMWGTLEKGSGCDAVSGRPG